MGVSNVDPVLGPSFTPPVVGGASTTSASQESAEAFAAILRAQMTSMMASATIGGFNSNNNNGGLLSGGLSGSLLGGGLTSGLDGLGGLSLGGGALDSGLSGLLMAQTLQPLTAALGKLIERLERLNGMGETPTVTPLAAPKTLPYSDLIEAMGQTYQVPAAFLGAVMMAESGGNPNAVGDDGASVGLFQLHERGMGMGLGDLRYDPELNASIGARGLAQGWHEGLRRGVEGEELVRFAYDYRFNPGGGFQYQGDSVYSYYRFYESLARSGGTAA